jgi:hypothetical protein
MLVKIYYAYSTNYNMVEWNRYSNWRIADLSPAIKSLTMPGNTNAGCSHES